MDSVYKGYPFGSLLLWRTKEQLHTERRLGPYPLPEVDPEYPIDYVLDGQQRLTSLFGVFQTVLAPEQPDERFNVYFDREADARVQATQFFALPLEDEVDLTRYFPLGVLFDVVSYRAATEQLTGDDLGTELEPFGFKLVGEDTNLLLRCCSAIIQGEAAPSALMQLNGDEVRNRFDEIENGIKGAIDFLRTNVHAGSMRNLPFGTLIVPLSVFFASPGSSAVGYSGSQRLELLKWFWRSCFSRRYSSDVIRKLEIDIREMLKLKNGEPSGLAKIDYTLSADLFLGFTFNTCGVNTKSLILLLAQYDPRSFVSGAPIGLQRVLKDYNRNEFHHLYPRKYLKDQGRDAGEINRLANFVFMSRADNNTLGGVAPSAYRAKLHDPGVAAILAHALCPESLFGDDYDVFVRERAAVLAEAARELCENGDPHAIPEVPGAPEAVDAQELGEPTDDPEAPPVS